MLENLITWFFDSEHMNYTMGFSSVAMKILAVYGAGFWLVAFATHIFLFFRQRKAVQVSEEREPLNIQELDRVIQPKRVIIAEVIADILFWIGACLFALIFPILSGFGFIWTSVGCFLMLLFFALCLLYQMFRVCLYDYGPENIFQKLLLTINRLKLWLSIALVFCLFMSLFVPLILKNSCLCVYNSGYGLPVFMEFEYSSQFTRGYWLPDRVCKDDDFCHVYASLPSNTSSAVFINVQTGNNVKDVMLAMVDGQTTLQFQCQRQGFPDAVEDRGQRHLYTCLATQLRPATTYTLQLFGNTLLTTPHYQSTYVTLPTKDDPLTPVRVVFGGDFGFLDEGRELVSHISDLKPDLIMIGGDVAYDNGNVHCYYSWDLMMWQFEEEFDQMNRIVPFLFAVGNHDVGFNALAYVNVTVSWHHGPFYFSYFPHHFEDEQQQSGIPKIENRRTYYKHFIKNLMFVGLDSGYLYNINGTQSEWLIETFTQHAKEYYLFAHYHNPIYPTCQLNISIMGKTSGKIGQSDIWLPIFDKFNMIGASENHVHQFKRTYPLRGGKTVNDSSLGTVYFGDGAMGVHHVECMLSARTDSSGLFAAYDVKNSSHYWVMDMHTDNTIEYIAYQPNMTVMDKSYYKMNLKNRPLHQDL